MAFGLCALIATAKGATDYELWQATQGVTSASLSGSRVPTNQLGSGTATSATFLRGDQSWAAPSVAWGAITGTISGQTDLQSELDGKAASAHTHAASDVASGTIATVRLGSGTASSTTFLRGDQTWATAGGFSLTEVEIDCGNKAAKICKVTVVDASVSASTNVTAWQSGEAATGRQADEAEFADLTCRTVPAAGQFTLICGGDVFHGKFKIYYALA